MLARTGVHPMSVGEQEERPEAQRPRRPTERGSRAHTWVPLPPPKPRKMPPCRGCALYSKQRIRVEYRRVPGREGGGESERRAPPPFPPREERWSRCAAAAAGATDLPLVGARRTASHPLLLESIYIAESSLRENQGEPSEDDFNQ
eukprot:scaffold258426_cov30-Tisochrysis_lutea.AAC.2